MNDGAAKKKRAQRRARHQLKRGNLIGLRFFSPIRKSFPLAVDQARIAAEHAHAEASVALEALSEHLEAFEAEAAALRSRTLLARLVAAWKGE